MSNTEFVSTTLTDLCTYELPHAQILTELLVEHQHTASLSEGGGSRQRLTEGVPGDDSPIDVAAVYVTISTLLEKITAQIQAVIPRLDVAETEV